MLLPNLTAELDGCSTTELLTFFLPAGRRRPGAARTYLPTYLLEGAETAGTSAPTYLPQGLHATVSYVASKSTKRWARAGF